MLGIAEQLRDFAHVELATTGAGALREAALAQGIPVHVIQASARINTFGGGIRSFGPFKLIQTAWDVVTYNLRFAKLLRQLSPDWVVANDLRSLLLTAVGARLSKVPIIWYVRDDMRQGFLHGIGVQLAHWVVTVSDGVQSVFTAGEKVRLRGRITTIYTGIYDVDESAEHQGGRSSVKDDPSQPIIVVTVGMLTPRKGQQTFISIAQELSQGTQRPLRFWIVGSAPEGYEEYQAEISEAVSNAKLKPEDSLELLGWRDDVGDILRNTDILLHPSTGEGLPRILLEALSKGVSVVTYAVSGADEIIPTHHYGYVVPLGDADAMKRAAARLIEDTDLRIDLSKRGPERIAREFSVTKAKRQITILLQKLRENASTRPD